MELSAESRSNSSSALELGAHGREDFFGPVAIVGGDDEDSEAVPVPFERHAGEVVDVEVDPERGGILRWSRPPDNPVVSVLIDDPVDREAMRARPASDRAGRAVRRGVDPERAVEVA